MDKRLHKTIIDDVEELKELVSKYSLTEILNTVALVLKKPLIPGIGEIKLSSPIKQCFYLIGVVLTTSEPKESDEVNPTKLFELLNKIFQNYAYIFWPTIEEKDNLTDEWRRCREVAMPAFLHFFNTSLLASSEQIINRINDNFRPFSNEITSIVGLTLEEIIEITEAIAQALQNNFNSIAEDKKTEENLRLGMLEKIQEEGWSVKQLQDEGHRLNYLEFIEEFLNKLNEVFIVDISKLAVESELIEKYLKLFTSKRGTVDGFTYITELNPAELRPLIYIESNKYFCPSVHSIHLSILKNLERVILESKKREKYYKYRDNLLERQSQDLFLSLLGDDAKAYSSLYETKDQTFEHDTVILTDRNLYIIEAKASPPLDPFRDPEKAYTRLRRQFNSNKGIRKGYEQAERLRKKLSQDNKVILFDQKSNPVLELNNSDFDNVYTVCITRDDYGPLATNLNLLLEKDTDSPFPWVINILDLETIIQGFKHLGLNESNLCEYLNTRLTLHGKVFGTDELEFLGFYIQHGWEGQYSSSKGISFLAPEYSEVFDEIYLADKNGTKVTIVKKPAVLTDVKQALFGDNKSLKKKKTDSRKKERKRKKQARRNNRRKK